MHIKANTPAIVRSLMVFLYQLLTLGAVPSGGLQTLKIVCQVCKVRDYVQHIGKNYYRVRHYTGLKNGKPQFKYHRQDPDYARRMCEGTTNIDLTGRTRVDQNLKALSFSNGNTSGTGSLVWIGHRPPKPVVVGSNPTPPATDAPHTIKNIL